LKDMQAGKVKRELNMWYVRKKRIFKRSTKKPKKKAAVKKGRIEGERRKRKTGNKPT